MTEQPTDIAPADFDLDAWIDGTKATERSCVIVGRGDLVAKAEDLLRRHEAASRRGDAERSVTDESPAGLEAEMERLEAQLEASKSIWHLKALTPEEIKAAAKAAESAAARSGDPAKKDNPEYTAYQVAAAVVRVERADGHVSTGASPEQILRLRARLGDHIVLRLVQTLNAAMSEDPSISAPFSRKSSRDPAGLV